MSLFSYVKESHDILDDMNWDYDLVEPRRLNRHLQLKKNREIGEILLDLRICESTDAALV